MTATIDFILNAARKRFSDYGPCKTTMAEIAKDCDMSVGNLYRHFENKSAMMIACLEQQLQEKLDAGITVTVHHDGLDALRAFLQTRLKIGHAQFADTRHLFDLFIAIESRHRDLLLAYEEKVIVAIANILQKGVQQGQFSCGDTMQTAYDIHQATLRYNNPINLQNNSLERLSIDLDRLLDLLYSGLQSR
ncbi:MAG: TetR/AcrR family transcriptional regulator [Mariprofundales bacterium]|nr:TetR/AcrR family transcriptional regulator [Mariprofundales bacterium]